MEHDVANIKPAPRFVPYLRQTRAIKLSRDRRAHDHDIHPENSALLLIDHQVGTMQLIKNIDVARARRMSLALAKTASILGIPTVPTSSQEDRVQGPLLPIQGYLPRPSRSASSAKASSTPGPTPTSRPRSRRRAKNLIMAGVTTDVCLVFPAIDAVTEGYNVQAVMDASGSPYELSEDMSAAACRTPASF